MKRNRLIMGILVLVLTSVYFYLGRDFPSAAKIFPNVLSGLLFIFGMIMIFQGFGILKAPNARENKNLEKRDMTYLVGIAVVLYSYVKLMQVIGFIPITVIFLVGGMGFLGFRQWWKNILLALIGVVVIYYIFTQIMYVPLPAGIMDIF